MIFRPAPSTIVAAILVAAFGGFVLYSAADLHMGTARSMGPGYFPTMIGYLLLACSVMIILFDRTSHLVSADIAPLLSVAAGILAFALLVRVFGFVPAIFAAVMISALGDKSFNWYQSLLVSLGLAAMCWLIFVFILRLRIEPFLWPM